MAWFHGTQTEEKRHSDQHVQPPIEILWTTKSLEVSVPFDPWMVVRNTISKAHEAQMFRN